MQVLLIDPSARKFRRIQHVGKQPKSTRYPGLGLATVAALCPPDVNVSILDDEFEEIDYRRPVELVGISLLTYSARRDMLRRESYLTINTIQASRGCPFACEFCSITALFGRRTRCRPVEEVLAEIGTFAGKYFVFNDDNLGQEYGYYKDLFPRLIPLKKVWFSNASWNIVQDSELLNLIKRSGCAGLFIGFESIGSQQGVKKTGRDEDRTLLVQGSCA